MKSKIEGEIENHMEDPLQQGQLYYTYIITLLYSTLVWDMFVTRIIW
jgi:hypothetical protein